MILKGKGTAWLNAAQVALELRLLAQASRGGGVIFKTQYSTSSWCSKVTQSNTTPASNSDKLQALMARVIENAGGWIPFDRFMALALYAPTLGYYSQSIQPIGLSPSSSDFVTAPEMSRFFSQTLARSVLEALDQTQTDEVWEFGAGNGTMAKELLSSLGHRIRRYVIVDVSMSLKERQAQVLAEFKDQVTWVHELPPNFEGVVLGNEVLDAMPIKLLQRTKGVWLERGVSLDPSRENMEWRFEDRESPLRTPLEPEGFHDYLTEIHPQAEAFINTLADRLTKGAVFLIDYGFPEKEYYHPERCQGTLMCHRAHLSDTNPLVDVGLKDITAHVNFSSVALTAQNAGMNVLGYTTQAHFLINSGLLDLVQDASLQDKAMVQKLIAEHEMGELFKVIALGVGEPWEPMGFAHGDRSHTL